MKLPKKPGQTDPAENSEDDSSECLGDAIFYGVLFWVVIISVPAWFIIVDEKGRDLIKEITLGVIILDFLCAWLVAAIVKKWFNRKNLTIALSICFLVGAGVLWSTDHKVWALVIGLLVCTADAMVYVVWLAERFLDSLSHEDEPER